MSDVSNSTTSTKETSASLGTPQTSEESGAVLITAAGGLIGLLILIALALDAGNLYRARIALQNAADAAALSGIGHTTQLGKFTLENDEHANIQAGDSAEAKGRKITEYLEPRALAVARAVMGRSGYPHDPDADREVTFAVDEFLTPEGSATTVYSYRVAVQRRVDFLLFDKIPGVNTEGFLDLSATATSTRKVANVMVFLDISDSMNCPVSSDCLCMRVASEGPCEGPFKIDALTEAVKVFLKMFDPARDRIYFVPFNIRGAVFTLQDYIDAVEGGTVGPPLPPVEELREEDIDLLLDLAKLTVNNPESSTNICDAFMRGRQRLEADRIFNSQDVSYLLFTDGAPTAGRFLFSPASINGGALPEWDLGAGGVYDYTSYTVAWVEETEDGMIERYGPSPLVQTNLLTSNFAGPEPPAEGSGQNDDGTPSAAGWAMCSVNSAAQPLRPVSELTPVNVVARDVFAPCLRNLGSHIPGEPDQVYGDEYDDGTGGGGGARQFHDYAEMYYNCAIQLSDHLRANRGIVHVIGLGEPAEMRVTGTGESPIIADPYQGVEDMHRRHDIFNARLAADDLYSIESPQLPEGVPPQPYPEWTYEGYEEFADIIDENNQGTYKATPNAAELRLLFEEMAQIILHRLVE